VQPGTVIHARLQATSPAGHPLNAKWVLTNDPQHYITGGMFSEPARVFDDAISNGDINGADIQMPVKPGPYFLYAYVRDDAGGAATAVVPLDVSDRPPVPPAGPPVALPFKLYGGELANAPYAWSGYMGDHQWVAVDLHCTDNPHSGVYCMKLQYKSRKGFGGVVAQNPHDDWGDLPGGFNLTGATKLTFWARGEEGGEDVSFKLGILGKDAKFCDSDQAELPDVILTKDWTQYTIDLAGKNLQRIKTGFVWVLAANGKPVTFYLDDIQYE
jgi:hypothetical protein